MDFTCFKNIFMILLKKKSIKPQGTKKQLAVLKLDSQLWAQYQPHSPFFHKRHIYNGLPA